MQRFIILLIIILYSTSSHAQFNFGIKGGVNLNEFIPDRIDLTATDMTFNPAGGLFFRFRSDMISISPEVLYSQKNGGFNQSVDSVEATYKVSFIDVPVMIGFHFWIFNIHTGPIVSFLLDETIEIASGNNSVTVQLNEQVFNEMNFGWQAGLGFEIGQFLVGARYEFSASELMTDFAVPNSSITMKPDGRNSMFQLTVGVKFLKITD